MAIRKAFVTLAVLLGAAAASFQFVRSAQPAPASGPVTPVTIVEREVAGCNCPDPARKLEMDRLFALRSDGAKARKSLLTGRNNSGTEARNVLLPADGVYVVLVDAIRVKSTMYMEQDRDGRARTITVYPRCADPTRKNMTFVAEEKILGYKVYRHLTETTHPTGERVQTTLWLAPDLNCEALRVATETFAPDGKSTNMFEKIAQSVVVGEPDPSLFQIPPDYREVPPSQANRELHQFKTGAPFDDNDPRNQGLLRGMDRMDQQYWKSQRHKPAVP